MTENIQKALEYAVDLASKEQKIVKDASGVEYYDKNSHNLELLEPKRHYPTTLELSTLASLVDYYRSNLNRIADMKTIVVVESPSCVCVYTEDDDRKKRTKLLQVVAQLPEIRFDCHMSQERFNIMLQSKFVDADDRDLLLDYASKIAIQDGADIEDNGVSQVTTVRSGVASKGKAVAPNPVKLKPYRTFVEVEQPSSEFIYRIDKNAEMGLYEADGGMWIIEAKRNIAEYLKEKLKHKPQVNILS
ncbi:hypothetical protein NHG29_04115 [Aerococcaceae bacterium NML160702]|nr:hypothetical protein [Aerococcaceae bacterium NML160702]